jgi:hypothetical protein
VEQYNPLGDPFDPNRHMAMFEVPDPTKEAGTVAIVTKVRLGLPAAGPMERLNAGTGMCLRMQTACRLAARAQVFMLSLAAAAVFAEHPVSLWEGKGQLQVFWSNGQHDPIAGRCSIVHSYSTV